MSQLFREDGTVVPVTLVHVPSAVVTRVKTVESDGYASIKVAFGHSKRPRKAQKGAWGDLGAFEGEREYRTDAPVEGVERGIKVDVSGFAVGDKVDVIGTSKGRGFQGVVKRHGFKGHYMTHGTKDAVRMPGSIGAGGVQRVFKGIRMAGHMGDRRITVKNLVVADVRPEEQIIALKGAVPGSRHSLVMVQGV